MVACRSDMMVRTKAASWIASASFVLLIAAALLLPGSHARGASTSTKVAADSAARPPDEGISVRVIEHGTQTVSKKSRSAHPTAEGQTDEVDVPDKPEPPEPPEPPDSPRSNENNLVRFGQDIVVPAGKVIEGDVVTMGGDVTVFGHVKGTVTAVGGGVSVRDKGVVDGDAVSVGGSTTVSDSATVAGQNVSVGSWPFKGHGSMLPVLGIVGLGALAGVFTTIVQFLLTILFAWLCLLLMRERVEHAVTRMGTDFWKCILWGLLGWMGMIVAIPTIAVVCAIAMVILVITIIGIPVAILLAIAMVFALMAAVLGIIIATFVAYLNGAMYLGRRVLARRSPGASVSPLRAIVVGALVILGLKALGGVLGLIGVVFVMPLGIALGIMAGALLAVFTTAGLGSMILTRFSKGSEAGATVARPAAPGAGWYAPPPTPPSPVPPPAGGTSDAP